MDLVRDLPAQIDVAIFCGSRDWKDEHAVAEGVALAQKRGCWLVVHGGARGADRMAGRIAEDLGVHVARVGALWPKFKEGAGPKRNSVLVRLAMQFAPDCAVFAFNLGTAGTTGCIGLAFQANLPIMEVGPQGWPRIPPSDPSAHEQKAFFG